MTGPLKQERLLYRTEVADLLRVHPMTVSKWAREGKLRSARTLGGHRRFRESEVRALLEGKATDQGEEE